MGRSNVVRLPIRSAEEYDDAVKRMAVPAQPEAHGRILVVDDEPGIRSAMVRMLKGNEVVEAGSGEEARKVLEADQAFEMWVSIQDQGARC